MVTVVQKGITQVTQSAGLATWARAFAVMYDPFIEHVGSESPALACWQDRLAGPWRRFAQGCRCNRANAELIVTCGYELEHVSQPSRYAIPPIVRPLIAGQACPATTGGEVDG